LQILNVSSAFAADPTDSENNPEPYSVTTETEAGSDFVITVQTDNPGTSTDLQFTIPTDPGLTYNYDVDCDNNGSNEISSASGDYPLILRDTNADGDPYE